MTGPQPESPRKNHPWASVAGLLLLFAFGATALLYSVRNWSAPGAARRLVNPVPPTSANISAGMSVYNKHCESCHGAQGDGKGEKASELSIAPTDLTASPSMTQVTDGELFWKISEGRRPMPGFKDRLSEEERWQVVDYVRTLRQKPAARPPAQP